MDEQVLLQALWDRELDGIRRQSLLWLPVLLGLGIGVYFSLRFEPSLYASGLAGIAVLPVAVFARRDALRVLVLGFFVVLLGFNHAALRARLVAAPIISAADVVNVEGRIVRLDRSSNGRLRLTLDRLWIGGLTDQVAPRRVRVTVTEKARRFEPGDRVLVRARISPPGGPVEPGGFDYRRMAWFQGLGGVGFALGPVMKAAGSPAAGGLDRIRALRMDLSQAVQDRILGVEGGFAAAIFTGDRSEVDPDLLEDLRASNLAHLLAISGLHMGLLTGFVFAAVRLIAAAVPALALRRPVKKYAAVCAILAGAAYLVLSGASVATQRAFVMVGVMFFAVLIDRPAITIRAVALAAVIVLALRPESLIEAGFQMSFSATTGLVVGFDLLRRWEVWRAPPRTLWQRVAKWFFALAFASFVAGMATAPFSAFHFNQIAQYGLLANLVAVPIMGMVVMPSAVIAIFAVPFGMEDHVLAITGLGIRGILWIASFVANLEGSKLLIASTEIRWLVLLCGGFLGFVLLATPVRLVGVAVCLVALGFWPTGTRPIVLVGEKAKIWGVMTQDGRALNQGRSQRFVAGSWLENDGDGATQAESVGRFKALGSMPRVELRTSGGRLYVVDDDAGMPECSPADVVLITSGEFQAPNTQCTVYDAGALAQDSAFAIYDLKDGPRLVQVSADVGTRFWSSASARRKLQ